MNSLSQFPLLARCIARCKSDVIPPQVCQQPPRESHEATTPGAAASRRRRSRGRARVVVVSKVRVSRPSLPPIWRASNNFRCRRYPHPAQKPSISRVHPEKNERTRIDIGPRGRRILCPRRRLAAPSLSYLDLRLAAAADPCDDVGISQQERQSVKAGLKAVYRQMRMLRPQCYLILIVQGGSKHLPEVTLQGKKENYFLNLEGIRHHNSDNRLAPYSERKRCFIISYGST